MDYVADLLKEKSISYMPSGRDYLIKCLNPEHDDNNPSMRVDKTTGVFHCFSCGFKGDIFKYYGILSNHTFIKVAKLKEKLAALKIANTGLEIPPVAIPYLRSFRNISAGTLQKFEAFYLPGESKELRGFEDRIIFPIRDITGKIVCFQGRLTLSQGTPKYLFYPSGSHPLAFPAKLERGTQSIVLVEGIFDFLNCYDKGLHNTVCVFGTNSMQKDTKSKLQQYKMQGVTKVFIMFDGDDAGREAAKKLKPAIEQLELECEIITLEDNQDPGELSQDYINSIKEYVNG
jgi:DNA primase